MMEALRLTAEDEGITIQIVNPGFVATEMNAHNDFDMPFLMTADNAAKRICDGFERGGFEIIFPRPLAWLAKLLRLLPYPIYLPISKRVTRRALEAHRKLRAQQSGL